jgi:predicted nucleic acid-binding protein
VLDADGLSKLAGGDSRALSFAKDAHELGAPVVIAASTLTEVLRGGATDAAVHRVLARIGVTPVDQARARAAGELLGRVGMWGHRHALDAIVAVVALDQQRPVVLLTSDTEDMARLTEEPELPRRQRVAIVRI